MIMAENETSWFDRKISVCHLFYLIIIFIILIIVSFILSPSGVNDEAYQNFSFAATISSIILAVVSIIYSLQSGISSLSQLNGIKDIEERIGKELIKFSNLEQSIKESVHDYITPIEETVGEIQDQLINGNSSIDDYNSLSKLLKKFDDLFYYSFCKCNELGMSFPIHEFERILKVNSNILFGYIMGLSKDDNVNVNIIGDDLLIKVNNCNSTDYDIDFLNESDRNLILGYFGVNTLNSTR